MKFIIVIRRIIVACIPKKKKKETSTAEAHFMEACNCPHLVTFKKI